MLHHLRLCTTEPELAPARELLTRVCKRDLYAFVGERILERHGGAVDRDDYARRLKNLVVAHVALGPDGAPVLTVADLEVMFVQIDYGMGDRNPVDLVGFFKKEGEGRRMPASKVSSMLPNTFSELYVVCFVQRCAAHTTCVALAALSPPPPPKCLVWPLHPRAGMCACSLRSGSTWQRSWARGRRAPSFRLSARAIETVQLQIYDTCFACTKTICGMRKGRESHRTTAITKRFALQISTWVVRSGYRVQRVG